MLFLNLSLPLPFLPFTYKLYLKFQLNVFQFTLQFIAVLCSQNFPEAVITKDISDSMNDKYN